MQIHKTCLKFLNIYKQYLKLKMNQDNDNALNLEQSNKLNDNPIYKQYKDWLKANGVLIDSSVLYPAYFGTPKDGVIGVAATKYIANGQVIIGVPYDLIITIPKVKEDKDLLKIIQENPNIFKYNEEAAFSILTLYICRQLIKGKNSFYAPYLSIADNISLTNWTHWDMLAVQNIQLTRQMKRQLQDMQQHFMVFLSIFRRYPNVFPQQLSNTQFKQTFQKAYNFICTRAFGWSLPSLSLIPMADSLNHNNGYVTHMLIDVKLQKQPHQMYTVKHKKYNLSLLSQLYPQIPKSQKPPIKKHKTEKFVEKHKQILAQGTKKDQQAYILWQQYKAGVRNFRQLHFYDESCEQDNDTDQQTIQKLQFDIQKFRFYQKYETAGISNKNKVQQLIKYWKIFVDPAFFQQQQNSSQEQYKNTKNKTNKTPSQAKQIKQKFIQQSKQSQGSSLVSSSSSSDSDDEEFKWMAGNPDSHNHKTTYFIMATRKNTNKNQQIYNFYGRRSNRFLLVGYNFVLDDNKYDSFVFRINVDNWKINSKSFQNKLPVSKLINKEVKTKTFFTRQIRVKKQRICIQLVNHCRALLIGWYDLKNQGLNKKIRVTIPFSIDFEKKVLSLAYEFIKTLQKQFMATLQEQEQLLQKAQKHETKCAIKIRMNYKEILDEQIILIQACQQVLKNWKNSKLNIANETQMRQFAKIRHYLCSLERGKL